MLWITSFWWAGIRCGSCFRAWHGWKYKNRTGKTITDSLAVEIAGHYLKTALESGEGLGRDMYTLTVEETLRHLDAAVKEMEAQPA